jgi:hypothetical protein
LEKKTREVEKLQRDIKKQQDLTEQSLERGKTEGANHSTSQVKVVRLNNFVGATNAGKNMKNGRIVASSHSPSGLGASKDGNPVRKSLKVAKVGKSPYLNDCFKKGINQQSTSTNSSDSALSAKVNRKGAVSAEISESSMIVLKKSTKNATGQPSVKPVDNMKLMAAIQRMRQINPSTQSQVAQKLP